MLQLERARQAQARAVMGNTKHYALISDGLWTPPVKIGRNSYWPTTETDAILAARIAGCSDDEVREIVRELVAARTRFRSAA